MNKRMTFCEMCRKDVTYKVIDVLLQNELKGEVYEYKGKKAICDDCGLEVYTAETEDYNLKVLYDTYREKNAIIPLSKILEIPEKYGIGKRPLSLLLGWGEMTFSRYCDGDMPSKQYSDILLHIYEDPSYYLSILYSNKDNLKSSAAFDKSKLVTEELIGENNKSRSKIDNIIDYLICKCEDITPLTLQKVLYYIQGFYYAFKREYIFNEECEAWAHGPVYPEIYRRYSTYRFDPIKGNGICDESVLTVYEKTVIDSVIKNLCCYSGKILENFTHSEIPWLKTRGDLPINAASNRIIYKNEIGEYFTTIKERYKMINPSDIKFYSSVMFEQMK